MPVQQHHYPAVQHRAQPACGLGAAMLILTGWFFSCLSVTAEHSGLLSPIDNSLGTGESYSHTGRRSGEEGRCWWMHVCYFLEIWPPEEYALNSLNELPPLEISTETKKNSFICQGSEYICFIKRWILWKVAAKMLNTPLLYQHQLNMSRVLVA